MTAEEFISAYDTKNSVKLFYVRPVGTGHSIRAHTDDLFEVIAGHEMEVWVVEDDEYAIHVFFSDDPIEPSPIGDGECAGCHCGYCKG